MKKNKHELDEEQEFFTEINSLPSEFLDELKQEVKENRQNINKRKKTILFFSSIASAACILIIAYFSFFFENITFTQNYLVSNKVRHSIVLPDKTIVSLDANTQMTVKFYKDRREVLLLEGKAFFDVSPNKKRPFIVKTENTTIKVLGTKFEVINLKKFELNVKEGKVSVLNNHDRLISYVTKNQNLKLNKYYLIDTLKEKDSLEMALWTEGKFKFTQESLKNVLNNFAKYVDIDVEIRDKSIEDLKITGSFTVNEFDKIIDNLPLIHPVKIKKIGNKIIINLI